MSKDNVIETHGISVSFRDFQNKTYKPHSDLCDEFVEACQFAAKELMETLLEDFQNNYKKYPFKKSEKFQIELRFSFLKGD